jgi:hypothetical protein
MIKPPTDAGVERPRTAGPFASLGMTILLGAERVNRQQMLEWKGLEQQVP